MPARQVLFFYLPAYIAIEGLAACQADPAQEKERESYMDQFIAIINLIDQYIWGIPLCVLIIGCGIWLTLRVRFLQVRHLGRALKYMVKSAMLITFSV